MWNDPNYYFVSRYAAFIYNKILKTEKKCLQKSKQVNIVIAGFGEKDSPLLDHLFLKAAWVKDLNQDDYCQ